MTEVPDRRRETLEPIIRRCIRPGSRIMSDGWRSYDLLNQLDCGVYYLTIHAQNIWEHMAAREA